MKRFARRVWPRLAVVLCAMTAGCASWHPLPLADKPVLARRIEDLDGGRELNQPLDEAAVLRLVLLNNPTLAASRAERGIAQAQVRDAAMLPNPSIQANLGFLVAGAGDAPAWAAGFAQSLQGLVTRGARRDEARASAQETDARLLWESWVTLSRARQLVVDIVDGERRLAILETTARLLDARGTSLRAALARGDIEAGAAGAVFAVASDARTARDDARHTLQQERAELAALLCLDPGAPLPLAPLPPLAPFDAMRAASDIASMGEHRPDLAALRYGYAAQEARVRGAILSQFPPLSIGLDATRDSSRVLNIGPSVSFDMPLFDRQQSKIAIAEATRQTLHDEYTARIDAAAGEARALLAALIANEPEASPVAADTAPLHAARRAYANGDIDAATYSDLSIAALGQAANDISRDLYRREQRIALEALTGEGLPNALSPRMTP